MTTNPLLRLALGCSLITAIPSASSAGAAQPSSISSQIVWRFPTGKDVTAAPVVAGGVVYCGSTNGSFFALDAGTGRLRWKFAARFPISGKAAVANDLICFESGNTLHALDKTTGQEKWHYVAKAYRPIASMDLTDYHRSSPVIADGVVYYGDDWGNLNGINLTNGASVFQFTTDAGRPIRSTPAVKDGVVYFGDWEGDVFAVSLANKKLVWKTANEKTRPYYGAIVSEFLIHEDVLYFGSQHDIFAPLHIATGKAIWRYADPKHTYLPSTPLLHNGSVIIGTTISTNAVLCLNKGEIIWSFKAEGIFFTKPALDGQTLVINSSNFGKTGYLYLLNVETGKLINKLPIERASPSAPAIAERHLILGAGDGCIYAINIDEMLSK